MIKGLWLMALCCSIPVAAILLVRYMGWDIGGWYGLLVLICPLSFFLGIFFMKPKGHKSEIGHENHSTEPVSKPVSEPIVKEQAAREFPGKFNL